MQISYLGLCKKRYFLEINFNSHNKITKLNLKNYSQSFSKKLSFVLFFMFV